MEPPPSRRLCIRFGGGRQAPTARVSLSRPGGNHPRGSGQAHALGRRRRQRHSGQLVAVRRAEPLEVVRARPSGPALPHPGGAATDAERPARQGAPAPFGSGGEARRPSPARGASSPPTRDQPAMPVMPAAGQVHAARRGTGLQGSSTERSRLVARSATVGRVNCWPEGRPAPKACKRAPALGVA